MLTCLAHPQPVGRDVAPILVILATDLACGRIGNFEYLRGAQALGLSEEEATRRMNQINGLVS